MITLETTLFSTAENVIQKRIDNVDHILKKYKLDEDFYYTDYNDFHIVSSLQKLKSKLEYIRSCLHYFAEISDSVNLGEYAEITDIDRTSKVYVLINNKDNTIFDALAQSSFSDNDFLEKTDKEIGELELAISKINTESSLKYTQTPYIKKENYEE